MSRGRLVGAHDTANEQVCWPGRPALLLLAGDAVGFLQLLSKPFKLVLVDHSARTVTIMAQVDLALESSPKPISITPSPSNLCRSNSTAICAVLSSSSYRVSPLPNSAANLKSSDDWYMPIGCSGRCLRATSATSTATRFQSSRSVVTTPEYRDAGRSATGGRLYIMAACR